MSRPGAQGKKRTKCPLCGREIGISYLYQYSHDYKLTKSGRISKRHTTRDCGSMEVGVAFCECGANWGDGEFFIDENGYFIDFKYVEEHKARKLERLAARIAEAQETTGRDYDELDKHCRECICPSCDIFKTADCLYGPDGCKKCQPDSHVGHCCWHPDERGEQE